MTPYYQDEAVCIYHGDCREVLPFLPKTDLLLTDPPYGIGEARGKNKSRGKLAVAKDFGVSDWDDAPPPRWLLDCAMDRTNHHILFGGNYFGLPPASCWLVWDKDNGESDFADCELAWTNLQKSVRRLRYRWAGMLQEPGCRKEVRVHPTQKPEAVMRWALMQAPDGCNVLDPFMGSGTTLVAAKRLGRKAIGIEREKKYCDLAIERLAQGALGLEVSA
jgi:DNA modification methylase